MNKITLCGRLTKDNELRYTSTDVAILSNTIAVNREFKNKEGKYDADFINIVMYDKRAELFNKYTQKGIKVLVNGRLQTRNYIDKDDVKKYVSEVVVEQIEFIQPLDKKEEPLEEKINSQIFKEVVESDDPFKEFGEECHLTDDDLPF